MSENEPTAKKYAKPLPVPSKVSLPFWQACKEHKLIIPRCKACGKLFYYPRITCPHCLSMDLGWQEASGKGKVYTFSTVYVPFVKEFAEDIPYTSAIIELAEGVRMMSSLVDCSPEEVRVGLDVEVTFDDVTEDITLPKFRPTRA